MTDKIWIHKQSEVIRDSKPKGLMSALYDEYTRTALVDELIEACKPTNSINSMYFKNGLQRNRERIDAAIRAITGDKT